MFQTPEPVMRTVIIMFCSLFFFVQLFWLLSVINLLSCSILAGKVAIEVSEAVSQFSLLRKGTPGEHWVIQTFILTPVVWSHLQVLHSCPLSFSLYILKALLLYGDTRLGDHQGRFNHFIVGFIVWSHDTHVFWKTENMRHASNLILLY